MNTERNVLLKNLNLFLSLELSSRGLPGVMHDCFPFYSRMTRRFPRTTIPPELSFGGHSIKLQMGRERQEAALRNTHRRKHQGTAWGGNRIQNPELYVYILSGMNPKPLRIIQRGAHGSAPIPHLSMHQAYHENESLHTRDYHVLPMEIMIPVRPMIPSHGANLINSNGMNQNNGAVQPLEPMGI